jgi:hypothetical protein
LPSLFVSAHAPIPIIYEYLSTLDSADHDVMWVPARHLPAIATHASVWAVCSARRWQAGREAQAMRAGVKAGLSWHAIYFPFTFSFVNLISYQRPPFFIR